MHKMCSHMKKKIHRIIDNLLILERQFYLEYCCIDLNLLNFLKTDWVILKTDWVILKTDWVIALRV